MCFWIVEKDFSFDKKIKSHLLVVKGTILLEKLFFLGTLRIR